MNISMIPNNDVKTIHASQGDTERIWHFVPYANEVIDTSQDEFASINSIRGNTLVWNQLWDETMIPSDSNIYSSNTYTSNGITFTKNGDGSISVVGTATADANVKIGTRFTIGLLDFKHLIKGSIGGAYIQYSSFYVPNEGAIRNASASSYNMWVSVRSGTVISTAVKVYPQIFNLDKMFGTNIPTLDEFKALFPLANYVREQGSLLSFNGTGIKTVGKNLFDAEAIVTSSGHSFYVYIQDGYLMFNTGDINTRGFHWDNLNLPCPLYFKGSVKNFATSANAIRISFDLSDGTTDVISFPTSVPANEEVSFSKVIGTSGKKVIRVRNAWSDSKQAGINLSTTQLEFGSVATNFEAYTENTTNLPTETYFSTGMKSAGSVYDELTESKAITRIGSFVINGDSVNYQGTASTGILYVSGNASQDVISNSLNIKTVDYLSIATAPSNSGYIRFLGTIFYLYDNTFTDLATAKSILNANPVTVYYELATSSEQDINEDLTYPVYVNGTEELLPVNGTSPSTTPMDANIQYPDEARDVYFTYKQSEFESMAITGSMVCKGLEIEGETDENGITIQSTSELTSEAGFFDCKLKLAKGDDVCYSSKFQLHVERRP